MLIYNEQPDSFDFTPVFAFLPTVDAGLVQYEWWNFFASSNNPHHTDLGMTENFYGHAGYNRFKGDAGDDKMWGRGGDDSLQGKAGKDDLFGGQGNDVLIGGADDDNLYGGGDKDVLIGGEGADANYGGGEVDRVDYLASDASVSVNLLYKVGRGGHAHFDTYDSVEDVRGSVFDDSIAGDHASNYINGEKGNDSIVGHGGDDQILGGFGADDIRGGAGIDIFGFSLGHSGGNTTTLFDRIFDFDANGDDSLSMEVLDTAYAAANWKNTATMVAGQAGTKITVWDHDGTAAYVAHEVFLVGETPSDMGADDFHFW